MPEFLEPNVPKSGHFAFMNQQKQDIIRSNIAKNKPGTGQKFFCNNIQKQVKYDTIWSGLGQMRSPTGLLKGDENENQRQERF
jgi:hypothetical protein